MKKIVFFDVDMLPTGEEIDIGEELEIFPDAVTWSTPEGKCRLMGFSKTWAVVDCLRCVETITQNDILNFHREIQMKSIIKEFEYAKQSILWDFSGAVSTEAELQSKLKEKRQQLIEAKSIADIKKIKWKDNIREEPQTASAFKEEA